MPKVLIIGATGYIGQALALSLRSGIHTVYGIARSPTKAKELAKLEIIPVICPDLVNDAAPLLKTVQEQNISVVVACGADSEARKVLEVVTAAGKQRLDAYKTEGLIAPKLGYIYTSGTWVHGSSLAPITDLDPVGSALSPTQAPSLISWRTAVEQGVLQAKDVLDVMVVRPALVYGRNHAIWTSFFSSIVQASKSGIPAVQIPLDKGRPIIVHVEDVASGLHSAVDHLPLLSGTGVYPVFDLVGQSESMQAIMDAFGRAVGFKGEIQLTGSQGDAFAEAMSTTGNNGAGRARALLGWAPRKPSLVDGMAVYAAAFLAGAAE